MMSPIANQPTRTCPQATDFRQLLLSPHQRCTSTSARPSRFKVVLSRTVSNAQGINRHQGQALDAGPCPLLPMSAGKLS